jgi:hypothetical protein
MLKMLTLKYLLTYISHDGESQYQIKQVKENVAFNGDLYCYVTKQIVESMCSISHNECCESQFHT